ncbi:MAG: addiction module antidote protein [Burkholderiales bacterium]
MKSEKAYPPVVDREAWLIENLRDADLAAEYLNASFREGDQPSFMRALRQVAKAQGGISALARLTGMNRVALSRALSETGNPELRSLANILKASGMKITISPMEAITRGRAKGTRQKLAPNSP